MIGTPKRLKYWTNNRWNESRTNKYMECFDPSTGEVIALAPQCTSAEMQEAISAASAAFPAWANTPPNMRVQILFRMKSLMDTHLEELTRLVAAENGKVWNEAMGDVLKVTEVTEFACGIPHLMKGPAMMNVTSGYDTPQYIETVGVSAGIAPWNFPAMIPMGWMAPLCIATGNTMVLKAASFVPQSSMRIIELWAEAGLPPGVLNLVTCSRTEAEILLTHPDVKGVCFEGSTSVGRHIYATAAANGKRVQARGSLVDLRRQPRFVRVFTREHRVFPAGETAAKSLRKRREAHGRARRPSEETADDRRRSRQRPHDRDRAGSGWKQDAGRRGGRQGPGEDAGQGFPHRRRWNVGQRATLAAVPCDQPRGALRGGTRTGRSSGYALTQRT